MCEKILSVLQHKFSIHRTRFFCLKENEKLLIGIPRPSTLGEEKRRNCKEIKQLFENVEISACEKEERHSDISPATMNFPENFPKKKLSFSYAIVTLTAGLIN